MQQQSSMNGGSADAGMGQAQAMSQNQYNPSPQSTYSQQSVPSSGPLAPLPSSPVQTSQMLAAGLFGMVVVGTGAMGANLHKVSDGDMSMGEAVSQSLSKGAVGGIATAAATAASRTLTRGGVFGLAVTLATATGVNYLLTKP